MTQILALQFDCLVQENYAAFLYSPVESARIEDILRARNRSHFKQNEKPLSKLLDFVRLEVESEQRFLVAGITVYLIISSTTYYYHSLNKVSMVTPYKHSSMACMCRVPSPDAHIRIILRAT